MAEIISRPDEWSLDLRCSGCTTEAHYSEGDIEYQADGPCGNYGYYCVKCPVCIEIHPIGELRKDILRRVHARLKI